MCVSETSVVLDEFTTSESTVSAQRNMFGVSAVNLSAATHVLALQLTVCGTTLVPGFRSLQTPAYCDTVAGPNGCVYMAKLQLLSAQSEVSTVVSWYPTDDACADPAPQEVMEEFTSVQPFRAPRLEATSDPECRRRASAAPVAGAMARTSWAFGGSVVDGTAIQHAVCLGAGDLFLRWAAGGASATGDAVVRQMYSDDTTLLLQLQGCLHEQKPSSHVMPFGPNPCLSQFSYSDCLALASVTAVDHDGRATAGINALRFRGHCSEGLPEGLEQVLASATWGTMVPTQLDVCPPAPVWPIAATATAAILGLVALACCCSRACPQARERWIAHCCSATSGYSQMRAAVPTSADVELAQLPQQTNSGTQ